MQNSQRFIPKGVFYPLIFLTIFFKQLRLPRRSVSAVGVHIKSEIAMSKGSAELESLSPNLIVADVNRSVDFYTSKLGFAKIASVPDSGKLNWAMVMRGPVTVMFQTLSSIQEDVPELKLSAGSAAATFYIKVKGLNAWHETLKQNVPIALPMRKTFYGANEFAIKDPDGNVLMFAEDAA